MFDPDSWVCQVGVEFNVHFAVAKWANKFQAASHQLKSPTVLVAIAVSGISHNRMADQLKMAADLMVPTRKNVNPQLALIIDRIMVQQVISSLGLPAIQRGVNESFSIPGGRFSFDNGLVALLDFSVTEQFGEQCRCLAVMGDNYQAGGFAIKAMNQKCRARRFEMLFHLASQGAMVSKVAALGQQAGGLGLSSYKGRCLLEPD